jgi:hypothetical protein
MFGMSRIRDGELREYIRDAYILVMSGAAKFKVDGVSKFEVEYEDYDNMLTVTIEFVDGLDKIVERRYDSNNRVIYQWTYDRIDEEYYEADFRWAGNRYRQV